MVATPDASEKVRENRLRRMAERQGFVLRRSRRRDPRAIDYGVYWLIDPNLNTIESAEMGMNLDDVERWLNEPSGER